ncbi:unnamed protein product [Cylicocyclus nassatus]|uniref:G-protein coupled receptors family 1 profile domain-containing protein n=1 Tax=Cylicocyclus nassatus TaxID=53992 RepID=A0AA36GY42_CYLNA|nr:unnamed protein product [Cylicocyclus nassatus]
MADVYTLLDFNFVGCIRKSELINDFFWAHRGLVANYMFLSGYYGIYLRCVGITLISVQRFVAVCHGRTIAGKLMEETPLVVFVIVHWLTALLMIMPFATSFSVTFDSEENLAMIAPEQESKIANMVTILSAIILFLISATCYIFVVAHVIKSRLSNESTNQAGNNSIMSRRELGLTIQVTGLMIALLLVFIYNIGQFIINQNPRSVLRTVWILFHPIMNIGLSCIHPWTCFIFNSELRSKILKILRCGQSTKVHSSKFDEENMYILLLQARNGSGLTFSSGMAVPRR